MAKKYKFKVAITQMTDNGAQVYAGCDKYYGEAIFTSTFNHCYFNDLTLKKVKGGAKGGGNYIGIENNEIYRVMKFDKIET